MKALWTTYYYLGLVLAIVFSLVVIARRKRAPAVTLAWIFSFFILPYFGPLLYSLFGYSRYKRRQRKKLKADRKFHEIKGDALKVPREELPAEYIPTSLLAEKLTGLATVGGNELSVYRGEEEIYRDLFETLAQAKHHIHLEYYIFTAEGIGEQLVELLAAKAKEGVECRLLLDHVGSFFLKRKFVESLEAKGIEFAFFSPLALKRPWSFHLRNHRKLVIVDGRVGFIGSQNISSEYKLWRLKKIEWIDSQLKVRGPGTWQLQSIFLEDWEYTTGKKVDGPQYFPELPFPGTSFMQALPTGPDEHDQALEKILMTLIHSAESRVTLATPYFVPTVAVALSLEAAVLRGVKVDLLVPDRTDQWFVDAAAKSWFMELLRGGVNIYICANTFLHVKEVTIDSKMALIGSANMDERSFRLNFECSALIYDELVAQGLVESFDKLVSLSRQLDYVDYENQSTLGRLKDGVFRILSPLL